MTREEFIDNYLSSLKVMAPDKQDPTTRTLLEMIGSIYDLQHQISNLENQMEYLESRVFQ